MKKIIILALICMCFCGCAKKNNDSAAVNETVGNVPAIQNEQPAEVSEVPEATEVTEEVLLPDVDIELKYYRINSPEGLRVRESPSLDSEIINKYPDNYPVGVSKIDKHIVEIDGIKSYWVEVHHNNDPYGWVFGGYLKPVEKFPEDSLGLNEYTYTEYKSSYGELTPPIIDENFESFYIFSKDYIGEPQQFELDAYDMYASITYSDYKIFTGLYKDKQGTEGYFIVKMDLSEKKVIEKLVQESTSNKIVFLKPWNTGSEYLSVGRLFESEAGFYISINNVSEKLYWTDD